MAASTRPEAVEVAPPPPAAAVDAVIVTSQPATPNVNGNDKFTPRVSIQLYIFFSKNARKKLGRSLLKGEDFKKKSSNYIFDFFGELLIAAAQLNQPVRSLQNYKYFTKKAKS